MSAETSNCPKCSTPLPRDAPKGLCPECLLLGGFESIGAPGSSSPAEGGDERTIHIVVPVDEPAGTVPETIRYFGDYELLEQIAVGGMGVVFKARQLSLNRLVAVKMIRAGQLAREEDIRRFRTEAEAAANLKHPHIVAIHEVGEHRGQHYFSMDFIEGHSLAELVCDQPLEPARAARLVQTVAGAIAYAHQCGVLHRDLKPSNVMIDAQDQPHVTDFGLAKLFEPSSDEGRATSARTGPRLSTLDPRLTLSGAVMGSPSYMSPEQARGRGEEIGVRCDVYSLGAMLYELLTGHPPFRAATPLETMKLVVECEPVAPRALNPTLPRDLETICLKCLAKEPVARYATAQELTDELGRFLAHEPIRARPITTAERVWRWSRRKPALAALAGLTLVVPVALDVLLSVKNAEVRREADRGMCGTLASFAADGTVWQKNESDIHEAVFRYLFDHNPSTLQKRAEAYYLAVGEKAGADPADEFLKRFADHKPPVFKRSAAAVSSAQEVTGKQNGGRGLIFRLYGIKWISESEAELRGGCYEAGNNSLVNIYTLKKDEGKWKVVKSTGFRRS